MTTRDLDVPPLLIVLFGALLLVGCGPQTSPFNVALETPAAVTLTTDTAVVDVSSLLGALQAQGAAVALDHEVRHAFLAVSGRVIEVNGADVQVFEYPSASAAQADIALIEPHGYTIANRSVEWVATPHFYAQGRLLVIYIGSDEDLLDTLAGVLGAPVAGARVV